MERWSMLVYACIEEIGRTQLSSEDEKAVKLPKQKTARKSNYTLKSLGVKTDLFWYAFADTKLKLILKNYWK